MAAVPHPGYFAQQTPDKPALVMADGGGMVTYAELAQRSAQAAQLFAELGIGEGDTIAILLENHVRYPEIVWAAKDSGLRYVAISSHLNGDDAAYIVRDCGAKLLITSQAMRKIADLVVARLGAAAMALVMIDGAQPPFIGYETALAGQPDTPLAGRRRGASMLYSSGTTGRPKGIRTAIGDVPATVPPARFAMLQRQYGFDADMVFLNPGPFYHAGPLRFMMSAQRAGGTTVGFRHFDAAAVLAAIGAYGATHGFFVPTMFARMLRLDASVRESAVLTTLCHAIHAAAPCPIEVKRAMIAWWGPIIDELYAGTEAVGHSFITSREWLEHPGSVGRPDPSCRIKIVDDRGATLPSNAAGRILMANSLTIAYHGDTTGVSLHDGDGFASLGDVGYLDDDGYLYLTDRESHMIISGGVNIYPQEAETVLAGHAAIADVAVIGIPHADMGEEVKAVVQPWRQPVDPQALEADILAYCRERLSAIKCPRSVDFVEDLPRNPMGKLVKRILKDRYWQDTGRSI